MNPSVEDRLNSVVRAIGGVILPALPESASLAREQAMLAMGHIQIILAQMPATAVFEAEEAEDLHRLGTSAGSLAAGGAQTQAAVAGLATVLARQGAEPPKAHTAAVQDALDALLAALVTDGAAEARSATHAAILEQGAARARKDRQWFAAMGFDSDFSNG